MSTETKDGSEGTATEGRQVCVGLFGTCGKSIWRDAFMKRYQELGIPYFNPNKPDWDDGDAKIESHQLAVDEVILFPITSETYATGSLAETGYSILSAVKLEDHRVIIIMVDQKLDEELNDPIARKESLRARALVMEHLRVQNLSSLIVVDSLEEMLEASITAYQAACLLAKLQVNNLRNKKI